MQINANRTTLLDYLGNPGKSGDALAQAASQQGRQSVFQDLKSVEQSIVQGDIDTTVALVEDLENGINPKTLDNMIAFYGRKAAEQLNDLARANDIRDTTSLQIEQGRLTLIEPHSLTQRQTDNLNAYLQADKGLTEQLERLNRLSKAYEFSKVKEEAAALQSENTPEDRIVAFLKDSRSEIFSNDVIRFSTDTFALDNRGQAVNLIDKYKEDLSE